MTDEHHQHSNAQIGPKRLSKRLLIIAGLALVGLIGIVLLGGWRTTDLVH